MTVEDIITIGVGIIAGLLFVKWGVESRCRGRVEERSDLRKVGFRQLVGGLLSIAFTLFYILLRFI